MKNEKIYTEYKKMRKRERELLREHKKIKKAFGKDDANVIESSRRLEIAGKKLNEILREVDNN